MSNRDRSCGTIGEKGRDFYLVDKGVVDMSRAGNTVRPCRIAAQPSEIVIDLRRTALVVVDMQYEFCSPDGWLGSLGANVSSAAALVDPINVTVDAMRSVEVPILWLNWGVRPDRRNLSPGTLKTFSPDGVAPGLGDLKTGSNDENDRILQAGSHGAQLLRELHSQPSDIFVDKHRLSGFWDTPLDSILRNANIRTLLFAGVNADECVLATLMDANFHGYDTIMVEDAVATTSPAFCMEATLYNVRFCLGFTVSSASIVEAISQAI